MKAKIHNGDYHSVAEYKVFYVEFYYFAIHCLTVFGVLVVLTVQ